MDEYAQMKRWILTLSLCLLGCTAPGYQGKVSIEGIALGDAESGLTASGWKPNPDGKSWSRTEQPKQSIRLVFSSDHKVTQVSGGTLLGADGKPLVSFGQPSREVEKALGTPGEWQKPERPPCQGDPPAANRMIYRNLHLTVDNDAREGTVERVTLTQD